MPPRIRPPGGRVRRVTPRTAVFGGIRDTAVTPLAPPKRNGWRSHWMRSSGRCSCDCRHRRPAICTDPCCASSPPLAGISGALAILLGIVRGTVHGTVCGVGGDRSDEQRDDARDLCMCTPAGAGRVAEERL